MIMSRSMCISLVGAERRISLPDGVALTWAMGIARADMRRIIGEVHERREMLVEAWRRTHG